MMAWLIARNTFREATRDRVLVGVIVAGFSVMLATQGLTSLALGEGHRLVVDLGLSGISILGLVAVLTVGTSLVGKEIERRTIFSLLSRPIGRPTYLVGKWAGLSCALWIVAGTLGLGLWGLLCLRGLANYGPAVLQAVYLAGLELTVITALAVMCSAVSTPVLSALYTLGFYCAGQWSYDLRAFASEFPSGLSSGIAFAANVMPNLPLFNMRSLAAEGTTTAPLHLAFATAYAMVYCGCVLSLAAAAFEHRDFK